MDKRITLVLLLLFLFLPSVHPDFLTGDEISVKGPLFLIEDQAGNGTGSLRGVPVELYQRIPPYYLISAPEASRREIQVKGFTFHKIDWVEGGDPLFLLSRPSGTLPGAPPTVGDILFSRGSWYLVQAPQAITPKFGSEGFNFSVVPLWPLPLEISKKSIILTPGLASLSQEAREKAARSDSALTSICQRLEDFQTRYSYTDSVIAAAEWIHDQFIEYGFTDVAYDSFMADGRWQRNVVATKLGTVNPDKVLVIGGHYDSVTYDNECDPMTWAPGVDDNGTGTALTMDMARILAGEEFDKTLKFVPFAAEEQGLYGSYHFAEEALSSGMDLELMFNMDMDGNLDDAYLDVNINTDTQSRDYAEIMEQVANDSTALIPFIRSSGWGSDHYPFMQYGFNHVYVDEGDFSPHWHRCTDTMENISISYLVEVEKMIMPTIVIVANSKAVDVEVDCALNSIPRGENLPFSVAITNVSDSTAVFDVTLWIHLEGGQDIPFFGPRTLTFSSGQGIVRDQSIDVPGNAPLGYHTVSLVAETLSGDIIDRDSFDITVVGSINGEATDQGEFILKEF